MDIHPGLEKTPEGMERDMIWHKFSPPPASIRVSIWSGKREIITVGHHREHVRFYG
jgi:hypothetical protein